MIETNFEVKKGYSIPADWEIVALNQIASVNGRIGFRGYNVTDLVPEFQGAISLSPSNIQNGILDYSKLTFLSWEKYEESPEIKVYNGDILFVKTGSTYGKSAYVENLPWPSTINPQFVVFKKIKCNSRVLSCLLTQKKFREQIESITSGGAIPTMSQAKIMTCLVPLPTPKEQERIATALSDIDNLISSLRKLIEKKKNIKQGVMQDLLSGKRRLNGFKEEWEGILLKEFKPQKGTQINKNSLDTDSLGYPVMNGGISPSGYNSEYNTEANTIIISEGGNSCGYVNFMNKRFWAGGHCYTLSIPENLCIGYIFQTLKYHEPQIMALRTGSGLPNIKKSALCEFNITLPSQIEEQEAIAKVLSDMDAEIEHLESQLSKYEGIKTGMMQQLLTGKIRLI